MPDIWPFAAWWYRRNTWIQQDFCLFASFPWHSNAVTKLLSSGAVVTKMTVLGSASKICIIHLLTIFFTFICGRGDSFVLVLDSCDLVLL